MGILAGKHVFRRPDVEKGYRKMSPLNDQNYGNQDSQGIVFLIEKLAHAGRRVALPRPVPVEEIQNSQKRIEHGGQPADDPRGFHRKQKSRQECDHHTSGQGQHIGPAPQVVEIFTAEDFLSISQQKQLLIDHDRCRLESPDSSIAEIPITAGQDKSGNQDEKID